jgi:hypothetical protein
VKIVGSLMLEKGTPLFRDPDTVLARDCILPDEFFGWSWGELAWAGRPIGGSFSPVMKVALIATPIVASHLPTVWLIASATKRSSPDNASP